MDRFGGGNETAERRSHRVATLREALLLAIYLAMIADSCWIAYGWNKFGGDVQCRRLSCPVRSNREKLWCFPPECGPFQIVNQTVYFGGIFQTDPLPHLG